MTAVKYWDGAQWKLIGAIQGPQGIQGPNGTVVIYSQPTDPGAVAVGSLWIDTDEPAPVTVTQRVMQTYTMTAGYTPDRVVNPQATTINEVAAVLATLIDDLKTAGIIQP